MPADSVKACGQDTSVERAAQPIKIAPVFVFLASNEARFVTGEVYGVTGGQTPYCPGAARLLRNAATFRTRDLACHFQAVVHARRAERSGKQIRAAPIHRIADHAGQRHVAVADLHVDGRPIPARSRPEGRVLVQTFHYQLLELVVFQHSRFRSTYGFCSHSSLNT
jgi:hypothetical protein